MGIYFISHVGGHKYSANVMVYRRKNAFGQDEPLEAVTEEEEKTNGHANGEGEKNGHSNGEAKNGEEANGNGHAKEETKEEIDGGAAQCIWLARIRPEDCENLVRYTLLKGKVVKPETQLRGGFDRQKGMISW